MIQSFVIELQARERGFHLVTQEIAQQIGQRMPKEGLVHLLIRHTSAGLCLNENADPTVREDFELYFNRLVPEGIEGLQHTLEGPDDMPSHIKSTLTGHELTLPVTNSQFTLGRWQGIYLCEFRNHPRPRSIQVTIMT